MVYDVNILNLINEKTRQKIYELSERNKNTDAAIWKVYYHVVPSSISNHSYDKYYIGQCMRNPKSRWGTTGNGYKGQTFYRAIMKYGWDNIGHYIIVDNLLSEEADWLEAELIKQLKTNKAYGYNQTEG